MAAERAQATKTTRLGGQVERPRSLREQVYERLRAAILAGELGAGAPIIEADIAAQLGASRTPVRDALRRLETEGLLEPRGARGSVVRELKPDEVKCIFEIREALEALAARRAARHMTARDLSDLERLVERMHKYGDDPVALEKLDTQFHDRILALADGVRLKRMLGDLRAEILPWRIVALSTAGRRREIVAEHATILAALQTRDEDAIAAAMTQHVRNTEAGVLAHGAA